MDQTNDKCLEDINTSIILTPQQKRYIGTYIFPKYTANKKILFLIDNALFIIGLKRFDIDSVVYIFINDEYFLVKYIWYDCQVRYGDAINIKMCGYMGNVYTNIYIGANSFYIFVEKDNELINFKKREKEYRFSCYEELKTHIILFDNIFENIIIGDDILLLMINFYKIIEQILSHRFRIFSDLDDDNNILMIEKAIGIKKYKYQFID